MIDFDKVVALLLPISLRQSKTIAWLNALTTPLKEVYNTFLSFKEDAIEKLSYNGQVIYLKKLLNDRFDPDVRTISIEDGTDTQVYIGLKAELPYQYLHQKSGGGSDLYFGTVSTYEGDAEIVVNILDTLQPRPTIIEIRNLIGRYKQAGKRIQVELTQISPT